MKTLIKSALAAIAFATLTSCAGFTFGGETPYGTFVNNPDGSVTIVTKPKPAVVVDESAK